MRDPCPVPRAPCPGQTALEYAVFVAVVAAALVAMNVYVRRSIQANLKSIEDQINARPVVTTTRGGGGG